MARFPTAGGRSAGVGSDLVIIRRLQESSKKSLASETREMETIAPMQGTISSGSWLFLLAPASERRSRPIAGEVRTRFDRADTCRFPKLCSWRERERKSGRAQKTLLSNTSPCAGPLWKPAELKNRTACFRNLRIHGAIQSLESCPVIGRCLSARRNPGGHSPGGWGGAGFLTAEALGADHVSLKQFRLLRFLHGCEDKSCAARGVRASL